MVSPRSGRLIRIDAFVDFSRLLRGLIIVSRSDPTDKSVGYFHLVREADG